MKTKALLDFCDAIDATALSQTIQSIKWVVPAVQTVHILAIAAVMSSILMINLRLLGISGTDQTLARVSSRFSPVIWWSLPVLLLVSAVIEALIIYTLTMDKMREIATLKLIAENSVFIRADWPEVNMWCPQTIKPRPAIPEIEYTIGL